MEVRQQRVQANEILKILISGSEYTIFDISQSGLAILTSEKNIIPQGITEGHICIDGSRVATVKLEFVRSNDNVICFKSILSVPMEKIIAALEVYSVFQSHNSKLDSIKNIPNEIRIEIYELKSFLEKLEGSLEDLRGLSGSPFEIKDSTYHYGSEVFLKEVVNKTSVSLKHLFSNLYQKISESLSSLDYSQRADIYQFIRDELHLIYSAPIAAMFKNKRLGYAGDYAMMRAIYHCTDEGGSILSRSIHQYVLNHEYAQAVRNRVNYLNKNIERVLESGGTEILSVASGPAEEIRALIESGKSSPDLNVTLLDQDIRSLEYAQGTIRHAMVESNSFFELNLENKNIKSLIKGESGDKKYDLIYSAGLFDYLDDDIAIRLVSNLYEKLKPKGHMIIGNFDRSKVSSLVLDILMDWTLIYRTSEDLERMYKRFGKMKVEKESEEVNIFAVIEKE